MRKVLRMTIIFAPGLSEGSFAKLAREMKVSFRRGKVAWGPKVTEPALTPLGGKGVAPSKRDQILTAIPGELYYVVVEDPDGPWITQNGVTVKVYGASAEGEILHEIPESFAKDYDEYLKTAEYPPGDGADFAKVLDYFNLDVARIDRWKDQIMEGFDSDLNEIDRAREDVMRTGQIE